MRRIASIIIATALLTSCSSDSIPSSLSTDEAATLTQQVDDAVRSIDDQLAGMVTEEARDPANHLSAIAFRQNGVIRKIVAVRDSDVEKSTTHYFFSRDGVLLFIGRSGSHQSEKNGRLNTVTSLDGAYYVAGSKLTADILLTTRTFGGDRHGNKLFADAAAAVALFYRVPQSTPAAETRRADRRESEFRPLAAMPDLPVALVSRS